MRRQRKGAERLLNYSILILRRGQFHLRKWNCTNAEITLFLFPDHCKASDNIEIWDESFVMETLGNDGNHSLDLLNFEILHLDSDSSKGKLVKCNVFRDVAELSIPRVGLLELLSN